MNRLVDTETGRGPAKREGVAMGKSDWTPWKGMEDLVDEMDRLVDEAGGVERRRAREHAGFWTPVADVVVSPQAMVVEVELPGVSRQDIVLEIRDNELLVYGRRPQEKEINGGYQVMERMRGPFARAFALPRDIDMDAVLAVFGNGLLTVTLPKSGSTPGRTVRISIGDGRRDQD